MDMKIDHQGTLNGAEFCKLKFLQTETGAYQAFTAPGQLFKKLGFVCDRKVKHGTKAAYDRAKAKVYSAMA